MKAGRVACTLLLCVAWVTGLSVAQEVTATLRGTVHDPEGTLLPGVPVSVSSASRGGSARTVVTDIKGRFRFPLLLPAGDYFLSVNYPGFASTELGPIDLNAGRTTIQDITLQPAEKLTEHVEVTAHGNVVDTENTRTSSTFNTEFVEGLPIIGRNYQDILTLTPGVTDTNGDGNPNVQGARETGLQYRLDGGNITDPASGKFGQNLNIDAIEEIEVITAGAGAEYGRADGGFANIITKSGGNDFEGTFRLVWRGAILDGVGAANNNDTVARTSPITGNLRDFSPFLTVGGPLRKDKLWYFVSYQSIDRIEPLNLAGLTLDRRTMGHTLFGKLTWQVDSDDKLTLQYNEDPERQLGELLDLGVDKNSDAEIRRGGNTLLLRWTSIVSPSLLVEAVLARYDAGVAYTPVSDRFHPIMVETQPFVFGGLKTLQALYPTEPCSANGFSSGFIRNCDPRNGPVSIYEIDLHRGITTGPYPNKTNDDRQRNSIRTDLTYTIEDAWGEHQLKTGLEFADEKYQDAPINNPYFLNGYDRCEDVCVDPNSPSCPSLCKTTSGAVLVNDVAGFQILFAPSPITLDQKVESFNSSAYLQDVWKPVPNLTIQAGLRVDEEAIDTSGLTPFQPRNEKRKSIAIVEGLCDDALRVARFGSGISNGPTVCDDTSRIPGEPPAFPLKYKMDRDTPNKLRKYDTNFDGYFDSGVDGPVWYNPYTNFQDLSTENFEIKNVNLSPRFSVSWDPWADGKTKVFGTWGRYFDRLFLDTVAGESSPQRYNYVFFPGKVVNGRFGPSDSGQFTPALVSQSSSAVSLNQVDRNLRTPFTDVFTLGFEREIAPEWSVKVTYTQRLAWDLLQDTDLNHILCTQYPTEFNIPSRLICPLYTDSSGKVHLTADQFGKVTTSGRKPNGAPDLYVVNPNYNQVLRVGNYNSSLYRSFAFELHRRLHRNWQMQLTYTWSEAFGQAEEYSSDLGNDPSTADDEAGYLDYDQRHRVIFIATTILPKDVELGSSILWESGTPYSVIGQVADQDSDGNVTFRTYYPTSQRNDQRNGSFWSLNLKAIKRFNIGKAAASASLAVNNILNADDATIGAFRTTSFTGVQLERGPLGLRRFGRYWELGFTMNF
ncbi:MAG TPA: carboxypeptidase regulatory-like domain-containing protein [Candidatus Saccharimonadales bacterium]|nr:carboxypeptidase regulatory-like domain-containing protein [Candidatus Saccharimonadales bacterium]